MRQTYNLPPEDQKELWDEKTTYRLWGDFNIDTSNVAAGSIIPKGALISVDFKTRKATIIKNVEVIETSTAAATELKIAKRHILSSGVFLSNGNKSAEVTAIDRSNADYDLITISLGAVVEKGDVLFETATSTAKTPKNKANCLNYTDVKVESNRYITAVGRAYQILTMNLPYPVSEADKSNLGDRFMFI